MRPRSCSRVVGDLWLGYMRPSWFHQMSRQHIEVNLNFRPCSIAAGDFSGFSHCRAKKMEPRSEIYSLGLSRRTSYQMRSQETEGSVWRSNSSPFQEGQNLDIWVQILVFVSWLVQYPPKTLHSIIIQNFRTSSHPYTKPFSLTCPVLSPLPPRTPCLISEVTMANPMSYIGIPG